MAVVAVAALAEAFEVVAVEEIRLVAEAAGHPLPAEVIAGGIAIEQVLQEPIGTRFPVNASPVHDIGRHPHAGVVVQPSGFHQFLLETIHAGQTGAAGADVVGEDPGV